MQQFLSCFTSLLLLTLVPPLVLGLAVWICQKLFYLFVGTHSGKPLLFVSSVLSVPLREAGHALACMLFFHRIEEICLFSLNDPDGELGYIEHSYNPRNPLAQFGNLVYALAPVVLGLFAVLVIFLSCFRGALGPFFEEIALMREGGATLAAYASTSVSLIVKMFAGGTADVLSKVIGVMLLMMICLGIHVTPSDLLDAFWGLLLYAMLAALASFVLVMLDARVVGVAIDALSGFATAVTALFAPVLLFAVSLLAVSAVFFLIRTLLGLDRVSNNKEGN